MPNYCENELRIEGPTKDLKKFKQLAKKHNRYKENPVLNANNFIPYPEKFQKLDTISNAWLDKANKFAKKHRTDSWYCGDKLSKKLRDQFVKDNGERPRDGYNQGGYVWCCDKWGTKWGFCEPEFVNECENELEYEFNSAWSPPLPIILKMSEMFPTLHFGIRYFEGGMGFNGRFVYEKGKEIEGEEANYFGNRGG